MRRKAIVLLPFVLAVSACDCSGGGGDVITGRLVVETPVVDFGKVCLGDTATFTVPVSNAGSAALTLDAVRVEGSPYYQLVSYPSELATLGAEGEIVISYAPEASGDALAELVVESSDNKNPVQRVHLSGRGDEGPRVDIGLLCETEDGTNLEPCASSIDFGQVAVGGRIEHPVVIENRGCAVLTATEAAIVDVGSGGPAAGYTLTAPEAPFEFSATTSQTLLAALVPEATDVYIGRLSVTWEDRVVGGEPQTSSVNLLGTGAEFRLQITPSSFVFDTEVGQSATQVFRVLNTGDLGGEIRGFSLEQASDEFTIGLPDEALPVFLSPGGSVEFTVTYAPADAGRDQNAVLIETGFGVLDKKVAIAGGSQPYMEVDPPRLDFGLVARAAVVEDVITVSNTGKAPLTISELQWQDNPGNTFSFVDPPSLPVNVAAGASMELTVRFSDNVEFGLEPDGSGGGPSELGQFLIMTNDPNYADGYPMMLFTETFRNRAPVADFEVLVQPLMGDSWICEGDLCRVAVGDRVFLDAVSELEGGPRSYDEDEDALSYAWTLTPPPEGGTASLDSTTAEEVSFAPDQPRNWEVELVVSDTFGATDRRSITFEVTP